MTNQTALTAANNDEIIQLTADVVTAYISNNRLPAAELPNLIARTYTSLQTLRSGKDQAKEELRPSVPIRKSVQHDHITCLEDGRRFKSLRRHLRTEHGMTPEQYRAKWELPADYPMVAPGYAIRRSELAKQIGLGRRTAKLRTRKTKAST